MKPFFLRAQNDDRDSIIDELITKVDPGGEVNFRTRNERMHMQDEHHFRLRHQDQSCVRAALVGAVHRPPS